MTEPVSPFKKLVHWGTISSMAMTASITVATLSTNADMMWIFAFQITMCLALYNMWSATLIGPGSIANEQTGGPTNAASDSLESAESGRFCSRCCHIVSKKHHYCPWINSCVGHNNDQYYTRFLVFAALVTIQSSAHLAMELYHKKAILYFNIFNLAMSLGVLLSALFMLQRH